MFNKIKHFWLQMFPSTKPVTYELFSKIRPDISKERYNVLSKKGISFYIKNLHRNPEYDYSWQFNHIWKYSPPENSRIIPSSDICMCDRDLGTHAKEGRSYINEPHCEVCKFRNFNGYSIISLFNIPQHEAEMLLLDSSIKYEREKWGLLSPEEQRFMIYQRCGYRGGWEDPFC